MQSDTFQQQQMAQLSNYLIHRLLQSQRDGSDGLDARHNTKFFTAISMIEEVQAGLINMCKHGSTESRHGALAALQLIMSGCVYHELDPVQSAELQILLISHGLVPMLFDIMIAPNSTAEMRKMAEACALSIDGEHSDFAAKLGRHWMLAKLTADSLYAYR